MVRDLRFLVWLGPVGIVLMTIGMVPLMGFVPPPSPALDPEATKAIYLEHSIGIRLGAMSIMFGAMCFLVFLIPISAIILKIGRGLWPLAVMQILSGAFGVFPFITGAASIQVAAFRPDRDAYTIQAFADMGWFYLIMTAMTIVPQFIAIAVAALRDKSSPPLLPRWLGYFNLWLALLFQPAVLVPLFQTGPFAWDGLLSFWIPFAIFFIWYVVMVPTLLRALKHPAFAQEV